MKPLEKFKAKTDLSNVLVKRWIAERMYSQGYRFVGKHSAIKICEWTRKGIRGTNHCYKQKFYNIKSHRCVQMSPAAFFCDFNCLHCWRSLNFTTPKKDLPWDSPKSIFESCISEQKKIIQGFKGLKNPIKSRIEEAEKPTHFAISLSGEPTLYPYLPELIKLIKSKGMTAFLVTNGAHPEIIQKLIKNQPTNLYVSLHAPDKQTYKKQCKPLINNEWKRLNQTLSLLKQFSCNTVIRLTLSKETNMHSPEKYSAIIEKYRPTFVECKGYVAAGGARIKMGTKAMPSFAEMFSFAKEIEKNTSYKIINTEKVSNVILLSR